MVPLLSSASRYQRRCLRQGVKLSCGEAAARLGLRCFRTHNFCHPERGDGFSSYSSSNRKAFREILIAALSAFFLFHSHSRHSSISTNISPLRSVLLLRSPPSVVVTVILGDGGGRVTPSEMGDRRWVDRDHVFFFRWVC